MKPTIKIQFYQGNEEIYSTDTRLSPMAEMQSWMHILLMMAANEIPLPAEMIYMKELDEQTSICLN